MQDIEKSQSILNSINANKKLIDIKQDLEVNDIVCLMNLINQYIKNQDIKFERLCNFFGIKTIFESEMIDVKYINNLFLINYVKNKQKINIESINYLSNITDLDLLFILFDYKYILNNFSKLDYKLQCDSYFARYLISQISEEDKIVSIERRDSISYIETNIIWLEEILPLIEKHHSNNINYTVLSHYRNFVNDIPQLKKFVECANINLFDDNEVYYYAEANPAIFLCIEDRYKYVDIICCNFNHVWPINNYNFRLVSDYYIIDVIEKPNTNRYLLTISRKDKPYILTKSNNKNDFRYETNVFHSYIAKNGSIMENIFNELDNLDIKKENIKIQNCEDVYKAFEHTAC